MFVYPQIWYGVTPECWDSVLASYPARMMSQPGCLSSSWTSAHTSTTCSLLRYTVTSQQTQLLSVSLLCSSLLGPIKSSKNQYKPLSVWFRWPWKRLSLISAVLITTTGWSTSSSSQTTSSWCSQTFSCHPATMHRRVRYKDTCLKEQLIQKNDHLLKMCSAADHPKDLFLHQNHISKSLALHYLQWMGAVRMSPSCWFLWCFYLRFELLFWWHPL